MSDFVSQFITEAFVLVTEDFPLSTGQVVDAQTLFDMVIILHLFRKIHAQPLDHLMESDYF